MSYKLLVSIDVKRNNISKKLIDSGVLEFSNKELIFIKSKNGSGKSLFLKKLISSNTDIKLDQLRFYSLFSKKNKTSGVNSEISFSLDGSQLSALEIAKMTSYMQQDFPDFLKHFTVLDFVLDKMNGALTHDKVLRLKTNPLFVKNLEKILKYFFYNEEFDYQKFNLNTRLSRMSGGELQALSLIATIVRGIFTKILILDEPFNNLGYQEKRKASDLITYLWDQKREIVIFLVSHCNILNTSYFSKKRIIKIGEESLRFEEIEPESDSCIGEPKNGYYDFENFIKHGIDLGDDSYA